MRKATCYAFLAFVLVGVVVLIVNSSIYAINPTECWCHIDVANQCGSFCEKRGTYCTYYYLLSAVCYGDTCNQTWYIECDDDDYRSKAGGAPICWSCIDDGGMDHDGDDSGGGTN